MPNRTVDLEKIIDKLDITATMYKNAVEKYQAVASYLNDQGISASIYPQGSFRLGTIVRPFRDGYETDYDLDLVCELNEKKSETDAHRTKTSVGITLKANNTYKKLLKPEENRCWTLQYAKVDGETGFELDIVPSVHEDDSIISKIMLAGVSDEYAQKSVSITEKNSNASYKWIESNPEGYALWFDNINMPFAVNRSLSERNRLFEQNRHLYSSIAEIPTQLERSVLQRAIQVLKRHRDKYFMNKWGYRPISAIITTLSAQIASHADPNSDLLSLINYICDGLMDYSALLIGRKPSNPLFEERKYIAKDKQKWTILNPVNPYDNYADSWNDATAQWFFKWTDILQKDFSMEQDNNVFINALKNGLGVSVVESIIPTSIQSTPAVHITSGTKPYRPGGKTYR